MKKTFTTLFLPLFVLALNAQKVIPLDTMNWDINAKSYEFVDFKGKKAILIDQGVLVLKDKNFLNGIIEFDMFLPEERTYPGVFFRADKNFLNGEQWFVRTHLSGLEDCNQAAPATNGITPFQFYFGSKYSFAYDYKYNDWTHVKVVVNEDKAQVYLDYSETPNLSWKLFNKPKAGGILIRGSRLPIHIADIKIDEDNYQLKDFKPIENKQIEGLIQSWEISDKFKESELDTIDNVKNVISKRTWGHTIFVEEGVAANISRKVVRYDDQPKLNTVFAKLTINSEKEQTKFFDFGYSDRVVVILNGKPVYKGTNRWRTRDYRYLGTIGLFDGVYLNLKKGENVLLMAVSEDFGGWLITGKFKDSSGLTINNKN
ncbi:hypothetical protein [uncultured Winogradskyella sp.]|uniref:hypothetical protein n=1 Tax=uncultured Winogradskyella sp. TaxID=395353 RepID=UPI0026248B10|nr:hypothetical protein [uncultured Winogradskyella sp.]